MTLRGRVKRIDAAGDLSSLFDQDRSRWDHNLVTEGQRLLDQSARGDELTEYHVEAAIASFHSLAQRAEETNWAQIVLLYDQLMTIRPSPVVALNRAIAVAQLEGPERGLEELNAVDSSRLATYPFYSAALGELELRLDVVKTNTFGQRSLLRVVRWSAGFLAQRVDDCGPDETRQARPVSEV